MDYIYHQPLLDIYIKDGFNIFVQVKGIQICESGHVSCIIHEAQAALHFM